MDRVVELLGFWKRDKVQEVKQQPQNPDVKLNDEAVRAWNSVAPHPADKPLIAQADERELANRRAELNQIQQTSQEPVQLHPVEGYSGMQEHSAELPQPPLQRVA